jgi:hypothetical protein
MSTLVLIMYLLSANTCFYIPYQLFSHFIVQLDKVSAEKLM